uniref:C-type lectin domain-containing protein n=1 Tax=Oreochromis niloticus TaxID=8128 RepID=A0A669CI98_ORENI
VTKFIHYFNKRLTPADSLIGFLIYSGCLQKNGWNDANAQDNKTFFCYHAVVVEEEKTWEEALEYCREHHDDLASVASETEMLLIQRELKKHNSTEHVWIGLHFFSLVGQAGWLWVDRQEMDYESCVKLCWTFGLTQLRVLTLDIYCIYKKHSCVCVFWLGSVRLPGYVA